MPCFVWPLLGAMALASAQPAILDPAGPDPIEAEAPIDSTMIDRAVAVVGIRVITRSELELARWLESKDPSPVPAIRYDDSRPAEWWIEQVLLRELAGDISVYQPDPAAVRERSERLLLAIAPAELQSKGVALGATRGSIVAWVYGRMVVERFVVRNLGTVADPSILPEGEASPSYTDWLDDLRELVAVRRIPIENLSELR